MNDLKVEDVKKMFFYMADSIIAAEPMLTEIDNMIGDGDHGFGMARGFLAVKSALPEMQVDSVNELFKEIGMTMLDAMGGASGVIFGTMFISGYDAVPLTDSLNLETLTSMMAQSLDKIRKRGRANLGDKTMVDSYEPAVCALKESVKRGDLLVDGLKNAFEEARKGTEKTKEYKASRGRAESYGELSLGIPDPGAVSVSLIFKAMYEYVRIQ